MSAEQLEEEAMRALGKPYDDCSPDEQDAVAFAVSVGKIVGLMEERGVANLGELLEKRGQR